MSEKKNDDMLEVAKSCIAVAKKKGAKEASASAYRVRNVNLDWRDGKPEKVEESTTRGVSLQLFVDGRYASVSTSDLRPDALESFIGDSVSLAKALAKDEHRGLPEPELYEGQSKDDLQLEDPKYFEVTAATRKKIAKETEAAARSVEGKEKILSVTSNFSDTLTETFLVTSNGFSGTNRSTIFFVSASVSVKDDDGRRPEDYAYAGSRFFGDVPKGAEVGKEAATRALSRLGSKKVETESMPMVLDNRAGGRMVSYILGAMSGFSLQQKRSFLEGKLGEQVFGAAVSITDDPLIPRAFGSRHFDDEGIAAKRRPMIEKGVLKNYYVDTYYGRKLGMKPTSSNMSNLSWKTGKKSKEALVTEVPKGIFVTGFLGGNSNSLTGDFSLGVQGFMIRDGKLAEPVAEMNISGNHLEFWKTLVAVGNDPFVYSSLRTPTLVFGDVSFAGV